LPQHEAIAKAIIARDGDAARAAMHIHLDSVIDALRQLRASQQRSST
jgi:DNA-binding FadR family transcriptional regulator